MVRVRKKLGGKITNKDHNTCIKEEACVKSESKKQVELVLGLLFNREPKQGLVLFNIFRSKIVSSATHNVPSMYVE